LLKLRRIQLLGFKSFCDKTEVTLPGEGIAVVVGPNGCGKSNILDGVTWVLGEQSAKSLRGGKMEDVIFAGTRDRKALGMAEVSITLIDPEVYGEGPLTVVVEKAAGKTGDADWDESKLRRSKAEEAEQWIAQSQPGVAADGTDGAEEITDVGDSHPDADVVLKIRRRKFEKTARHGEIVVTRRLFRTGDSEYLLNGKLCRLADIRDIFMGTGLGPESYAIIGQERIGLLLSSKPHERRAIIEEAAGITRFKTKKRLAELRLEQARQNLARIDDIFDEVAKQMATLKRQAAKAERYGLLREELRTRLHAVLAGKLVRMEVEAQTLTEEIAELSSQINEQAAEIEELQAEAAAGQQEGYALDAQAREQNRVANESAVELERAHSRHASNTERIADLQARVTAGEGELTQAREQLAGLATEREQQRAFLQTAAAEVETIRAEAATRQSRAREAFGAVAQAENGVEGARREATQLLHQFGQARREQVQAEELLASLDRDRSRIAGELETARRDRQALGMEREQVSVRFEAAAHILKRLETELNTTRTELADKQAEEHGNRRRSDGLRSEQATLNGRRNSLDTLLREHSYSTDTVKKLLQANSLSGELKPLGTLADFVEVSDRYESIVDEFLRDELNYIVVRSWEAADEGMRLLKSGTDGRATFLVHPEDSHGGFSSTTNSDSRICPPNEAVRLKDCIRVLAGFDSSLEKILLKVREGYVVEDAGAARALALEHPNSFFLAATGECFHNVTVSGGKPRAEGPLALKRELREAQAKLNAVEKELAQAELGTAAMAQAVRELAHRLEAGTGQRRDAERTGAHESAALRQMDTENQRLERRIGDYSLQEDRARQQHEEKAALISRKAQDAERLEHTHHAAEARQEQLQRVVEAARRTRDEAQAAASEFTAQLAGLEERRRGAEGNFSRIDRMFADGERRAAQLAQQLTSAGMEQATREAENEALAAREEELRLTREAAEAQVHALNAEQAALRTRLSETEALLKELRDAITAAREQRGARFTAEARLTSELAHLAEASLQDLGLEMDVLRAGTLENSFIPLAPELLGAEEVACRELKRRMEAMGPVNMMALEEFEESRQRHTFLEVQRKDLLDSIENTCSTIKELDGISRLKFDEAFARINENFTEVFARLFGGGTASMRLTDEDSSADSGIDIVAQPPGKKLQNIFLLSGGEKALTALSLLMGIFRFQPAPFCVLDEVDAPLDETNVGRLAEMLRSMAGDTQFVMVTHSKRMMTGADMIYGVTMQEPGVSKLVSVRLEERSGSRNRPQRELAFA